MMYMRNNNNQKCNNVPKATGEWEYENMPTCRLPRNVAMAFSKATKNLVGVNYSPVLYVAEQIVNGTNYCIICKSISLTHPQIIGCKTLYIHQSLEGECTVTKVDDVISSPMQN